MAKKRYREPLYQCWGNIKTRCYNQKNARYKDYGGRGILMCKEWLDSFLNFKKWALGNGYQKGLEIDRIDNEDIYKPDNCRFVTSHENNRNKRNNVIVIEGDIKMCLKDYCGKYKFNYDAFLMKLKRGLTFKQAIMTAIKKGDEKYGAY